MELATGGERTIDGIANGERIVLGHAKTREGMRAGLAMYFVTLDDPELMELAEKIVRELRIEHFFNIQLVGKHVIEINPRISTIVYQDDLNLPYLGIKRALGEISDDELATLRSRVRPGRTALRYFDQVEWDLRGGTLGSPTSPLLRHPVRRLPGCAAAGARSRLRAADRARPRATSVATGSRADLRGCR
jgi:hypothetical protein